MFRTHVLVIRSSKLHYTASATIIPIGGRLVYRLREDFKYEAQIAVVKDPVRTAL